MNGAAAPPLLEVKDLQVSFSTPMGPVKAVAGLSFALHTGETLGLVGESGCGKTVTALSILRLLACPPAAVTGETRFLGEDLQAARPTGCGRFGATASPWSSRSP